MTFSIQFLKFFHIVLEIFRIVPSQFFAIARPRNGRDGFYGFYGSIFGHWRGMVGMWLYGATNWAGRALKRSRDTETVWAWKNRVWNLPGFWNRGARWFKSRGPSFPVLFFPGWPPTATPRTSMMHSFHHWQEPTCRFVHVADDFHPTHILKGILGRLLWAIMGYTILAIPLNYGNYYIMRAAPRHTYIKTT